MSLSFNWPRAHAFALAEAQIKQSPEDFKVVEQLPEQPYGEGEHLWLLIEKTGQNTNWVAKQIARWANVKPRDVSFAGLKDRQAVTQQTFSIHLPGQENPDLDQFSVDGVTILSAERHSRKLKTGQLIGNQFTIRLRHCTKTPAEISAGWAQIVEQGVPNYFGSQRFGIDGLNVDKGIQLLTKTQRFPRHQESIYLSAVRSYLFNSLLAERVTQQTWNRLVAHEFAQFTEGKAGFYCAAPEPDDHERCLAGKLSPCGSLPGVSKDEFDELDQRESSVLEPWAEIITALKEKKVSRHFRKFRVFPERATLNFVDNDPVLSFFLPAGCFATTVISELCDTTANLGEHWHE
ncbi:tRNA pseudouridine(13) synthase TruD [Reinekea thalattae]|uniref:tRNA pseudouridine synthase D n=1 Tax=Reinekea thalattae TaxID=2593301 RepID=A0A5C8ZA69_9GAMM|nr:tRNA pseudouridine(13) synthase TruD [Reinekea thalattae]TXR54061.1 tRNA pseudouridine(13) synthase TruD [Reinekea thalattae]